MRIGRKQKYWSSIKRGLTGCFVGAMLCTGAALAEVPEPPANSDIAFRLLPFPEESSVFDRREFVDHPIFRLVRLAGSELLDVEPIRFMDSTFEGTVMGALVSPGKGSNFADFLKDREARESWERNASELESLAEDLRYYFEENEEYPADIQVYIDEERYYEPGLSYGVTYKYERLNDGKDYRLSLVVPKSWGMSRLGPTPVFSSENGPENREPTAKPLPINLVIGAKILQKESVEELLTKQLGEPKGGFWTVKDSGLTWYFTIRGDWVVAADRMENLGGFLQSAQGKKRGLSGTPGFKTAAANIDMEAPFMFYADVPKLIKSAGPPSGELETKLASLAGPVAYSIIPYTQSQFRIEAFLGVNSPKGSKLETYFKNTKGVSPGKDVVLSNVPWDTSNVFALEYGASRELANALIALFPEAEMEVDMGEDVLLAMLGLDAESGFDKLIEGPTLVTFERVDIIVSAIEGALFGMNASNEDPAAEAVYDDSFEVEAVASEMEDSPATDEPATDESATDEPADVVEAELTVKRTPYNPLAWVPVTVAAQVPLERNRETITEMMNEFMGDKTSESLFGVDLVSSEDDRVSYAVDGDWMYVSGGGTRRLLRHMLEAAHGRKETLGGMDSWSRFATSNRGRLVGYGHQKVDAIYSITKGFLLFMGSEFRPLAKEVGELRDYHAMFTAVPDGFVATGEIVRGDGR